MNSTTEQSATILASLRNTTRVRRPPCQNPSNINILITVYCILICVILGSNVVILITFAKNKKLRTVTNIFFVSLAVSDILVGSVSIPMWVFSLAFPLYHDCNVPGMLFYDVYKCLDIFSALASTAHLIAISFERSLAITKPLTHRTCPRWFFYALLGVAWLYGLSTSVLIVVDFTLAWKQYRTIAVFVIGFAFPLFIIMILYALTYRSVQQYLSRRRNNTAGSFQKYLRREKRTAKTVGMVLGAFVVTWLPFFIVSLIGKFHKEAVTFLLINIVKFLHYTNSAVNPYIYTFRNSTWKRAFLNVVSPCTHKTRGYWKTFTRHTRSRSNKSSLSTENIKPQNLICDKKEEK